MLCEQPTNSASLKDRRFIAEPSWMGSVP